MKKVFFYTLGCKLNFAETSHISRLLVDNGFSVARRGEAADVCIVNTCSVTDTADRKCRQAIHKIVSDNPNAFIIVTGCYAQVNPSEIEQIDGVDLVLGAKEKFDILKVMHLLESKEQFERIQVDDIKSNNSFTPIFSAGDRTRYFLKVQDGCDYYCTYCTIPFARGKSRSASVAHTMQTIDRALEQGAKEIILTGVNIGDFGRDSNEHFIDLVKAIDKLTAEVRVRISSVEPNLLEDAIIDIVASSKIIAPHFHIPLQSGSNRVLSLMGRRYTREVFGHKVSLIKRLIPDAFIGVDVIVGMRGETADMFDETLSFLGDTPFSELHIFPYSEREGTKALSIKPIVSQSEKKRRSELLHNLSDSRIADFYRSQRGKTKTVLWETTKNPKVMNGYTENYLLVSAEMEQEKINTFQKIVF
ncbi:MAG: tRNA (N(6)-L-threonylcarbamoyladenosine(37)-C(2))-methylthiotransferase MtaB [Bacteroidetes bacterium]|nr:tRNA (N(6)-L-threonylcarbamoyladenosine(37)-C(2))-methylthiotransferase MtaB [Bacteroidota bacterium]